MGGRVGGVGGSKEYGAHDRQHNGSTTGWIPRGQRVLKEDAGSWTGAISKGSDVACGKRGVVYNAGWGPHQEEEGGVWNHYPVWVRAMRRINQIWAGGTGAHSPRSNISGTDVGCAMS